jgi:hypothetical protein
MASEHHQREEADSRLELASTERDLLIRGFLKSLKVAFKTASIYNPDHPAFHNAVGELAEKLDSLFALIQPFTIGFTPHSVFLDNRFWENERIYSDLGQLFHFRKIKGLVIHQGVSLAELTRFAARLTLPLTEFIKGGGALRLLKNEPFAHIDLDLLDYSQLLRGEGDEIMGIWPYLMMEAVEENDPRKLELVAESYERVIGKFNTDDLIQNEELQKNFGKFFRYLKDTSKEKYRVCAKGLLKSALKGKKVAAEQKFEGLKLLISDLSEEDLASTLWEEIIGNERFDSLSFSVFSKIISADRHQKISTSLRDLFHTEDPANRKSDVERKIRSLLKGTSGRAISDLYRHTLDRLLEEIDFEKRTEFDRRDLERSYRYLLVSLLSRCPDDGQPAGKTLERISEEWDSIACDKDLDFLACLSEVIRNKAFDPEAQPSLQKVARELSELTEDWVLSGEGSASLDGLVAGLKESVFEPRVYLDAMFKSRVTTPTLLRAYLTFFDSAQAEFAARLRRHSSASDLLEQMASALASIDTPLSLALLEEIYQAGDTSVKIHALQAMKGLTEHDEPFLFGALDSHDPRLKGEALILLARHPRARHVALSKLLNVQSPYGMRNRRLIRHIRIVEAKNVREAQSFLIALAQRRDFWNRRVRHEALRILEIWREG